MTTYTPDNLSALCLRRRRH